MAGVARGAVLPANWFAFLASWALRSAFRRREYTSLITLGVRRECLGWSVTVDADQDVELTTALTPLLRETDTFGDLVDDRFGILLVDADEAATWCVIHRIAETLATVQFSTPTTFEIGAAISPTNGMDLPALGAYAASHPALSLRPALTAADRMPRVLRDGGAVQAT